MVVVAAASAAVVIVRVVMIMPSYDINSLKQTTMCKMIK